MRADNAHDRALVTLSSRGTRDHVMKADAPAVILQQTHDGDLLVVGVFCAALAAAASL